MTCRLARVLLLLPLVQVPSPPVPDKAPPAPAAIFRPFHPFRPTPPPSRPPVVPGSPGSAAVPDRAAWEADLLARHNAARATARPRRAPLALDARLAVAAQAHAEDCARRDVLSHAGSDRSSPWDRIARAGYRYVVAGENAAAGWPDTPPAFPGSAYDPARAFNSLMGDPPHRANVLGDWTHLGVGVAAARNGRRYVVIDYARP